MCLNFHQSLDDYCIFPEDNVWIYGEAWLTVCAQTVCLCRCAIQDLRHLHDSVMGPPKPGSIEADGL